MQYSLIDRGDKSYSIAAKGVRTKMCDAAVRLVVIRTRPRRSQPYRYFCVFTTNLTLEIPKIITHYQQRWKPIETVFRDVKQHFGFNAYRLKSRKSINRFVQLSFIAAALTKLIFSTSEMQQKPISFRRSANISVFIGIVPKNSHKETCGWLISVRK